MNDQTQKEEHQVHKNNRTNIETRCLESVMQSQVTGFLCFQGLPRSSCLENTSRRPARAGLLTVPVPGNVVHVVCKEHPHKMRIKLAMSIRQIQQCLLFLGLLSIIIMAAGECVKPPERHNLTDSFAFSPFNSEVLAAMDKSNTVPGRSSALDDWLSALGFVYDPDLGRVRNPFAFPRAEDGPALKECFQFPVYFERLLQPVHSIVLALPGGGRTALRLMLQAEMSERGTPFSTYTSASKLYDELDRIARKSQRQQEKFIFLDLDDLNKNVDDRVVEQLICKIFSDDFKSFFFKGFLPVRFRAFTDTYQPLEIRWTVQDLIEIIQQRMAWASGVKKQSLAQICDPELQTLNPDQALVRMAATPRELLNLGQYLFASHLSQKGEPVLVGRKDWNGMMTIVDDMVRSNPILILTPETKSQCIRLRLSSNNGNLQIVRVGETWDEEGEKRQEVFPYSLGQLSSVLKALFSHPGKNFGALRQSDFAPGVWKDLRDLRLTSGDWILASLDREVGTTLYQLLIHGETRGSLATLWKVSEKKPIPLHLGFYPEDTVLPQYPWELLWDSHRFLVKGESGHALSLIRHIICDEGMPKISKKPLRVLYVAPRPTGADKFPRGEWEVIPDSARVQTSPEEIRTLEGLKEWLKEHKDEASVLHFDGHGQVGRKCPVCEKIQTGESLTCPDCQRSLKDTVPCSYLFFEKDDGSSDRVSPEEFREAIAGQGIQVIVLSTCHSSTISGDSVFNSLAPNLFLAKIPAVVGMQFPVLVKESQEFMKVFYEELAATGSVVEAVMAGRKIFRSSTRYWYAPTLYLRSKDDEGRLFTPAE